MFNVAPTLIRFWEREFDEIKPQRNKKGNRLFTAKDIETFKVIFHLVKERRLTLEGAKQELKKSYDSLEQKQRVIEKLTSIKRELLDIKKELGISNGEQ